MIHTHADKGSEKKHASSSVQHSQKPAGNDPINQLMRERPGAAAHQHRQALANNSPQVQQARQRQALADSATLQHATPVQKKANNTGLPDSLKNGIENLSGFSMDDVNVHYNSAKPAQMQAHAYAQGTDIHLASGQEHHLPHEAWHVVQQKQGRVQATTQLAGVGINDNAALESEATVMGNKAMQLKATPNAKNQNLISRSTAGFAPVQRAVNLAGFTRSQNNHYALSPADSKVLFSLRTAPAPQPTGLYRRETEVSTTGTELYRYKPNVRLYSKAEKNIVNEWYDGASEEEQRRFQRAKPGTVNTMVSGVENPEASLSTDRLPTMGMLGDNDCAGFAGSLRSAIAGQGVDNRGLHGEPGVGDQMVHTFTGNHGLACDKHSATVVARDGNSLITLEAHAGQDITEPDFHMRNGIAGFIADNNRNQNLGNQSSVTRANGSDDDLDASKDTFATVKENPMAAMAAPYHSASMATDVDPINGLRRQVLLSIKALSSRYWGAYTEWKFKPTGVSAIKTIVSSVENTPEATTAALTQAKLRATRDRARESENRHPATADFYMAIARMDVDDIPSLLRVLRNMAHITGEMEAGHTGKGEG